MSSELKRLSDVADSRSRPWSVTADTVHAEVARLLTTPTELMGGPVLGLFDDEKQSAQLRQFRGFITKVMHNGIRKFIPKTLRLLSVLKIELAFFIAVSPSFQQLRANGPIPPEKHLAWFEDALIQWARGTGSLDAALAKDVLVHEMVLHQAREPHTAQWKPKTTGALWLEGTVVLRRFQFDVLAVFRALDTGEVNPASLKSDVPIILAYWLDPLGGHAVTELDELTARVISLVDGVHGYADIANKFSECGIPGVDSALVQDVCKPLLARTPLRIVGHGQ